MASKIALYESEVLQLLRDGKSLAEVSRWLAGKEMQITRQSVHSWLTRLNRRKAKGALLYAKASPWDGLAVKPVSDASVIKTATLSKGSSIERLIHAAEAQLIGQVAGDGFLTKSKSTNQEKKPKVLPNQLSGK